MQNELIDSASLQKTLSKLLTSNDLCKMFQVTPMTIHTWRKDRNLPTLVISGGQDGSDRAAIRFHPDDIRQWAKTQGLTSRMPSVKRRQRLAA